MRKEKRDSLAEVRVKLLKCRQLQQRGEVSDELRDEPGSFSNTKISQTAAVEAARLPKEIVEDSLRVWDSFQLSKRRQRQRLLAVTVPGGVADRGLFDQQPGFLHPDWNDTDRRGSRAGNRLKGRPDLGLPARRAGAFGVAVNEQEVTGIEVDRGPNSICEGLGRPR